MEKEMQDGDSEVQSVLQNMKDYGESNNTTIKKPWNKFRSSSSSAKKAQDRLPRHDSQNSEERNVGSESKDSGSGEEEKYLVDWDGPDDPNNPVNMSHFRKWIIVLIIAFSSFCVTFNSSIYTTTYDQLNQDFGTSREVATLGLSTFVLGLGTGPMVLAPLSEFYGRRIVYIVSFVFIFIFIIPCAVAQNIQTILVTRFLDGIASSAFLSVAGGTIGDLFVKSELSMPMMVYSGSPFMGPALGPVVGGFINQYTDWRWTFWVLLIWTGVQGIIITIFVPETYHPVLLRRKAQRLRKETGNDAYKASIEMMNKSVLHTVLWSCIRPFQLLFLEPMVLNLCIISALLLGTLYLFFGAFPLVFENNHGFTLSQSGLTFLGLLVGMFIGILSDLGFQRFYARLKRQREERTGEIGVVDPEFRLPPTIFGANLVWIGLFGFGWTTFKYVHWIAPIIFSSVVGIGIITSFAGIFTFLVESYPLYAASALAANSIARSSFAAVFPLFGVQMYENLGYQWATSLLAFLMLAMAPFPYIFFKYGHRIRSKSKFASSKQ